MLTLCDQRMSWFGVLKGMVEPFSAMANSKSNLGVQRGHAPESLGLKSLLLFLAHGNRLGQQRVCGLYT